MFLLRIAILGMVFAWPGMAFGLQVQMENVDLLAEKCAAGKIDVGFLVACHAVIDEDAANHPSNSQLPPDFFAWLDGNSSLRDDARLAMAEVSAKVANNLQILRSFDEGLVEKYPNLAIAFAATWSNGDDSIPRRYWVDEWLVQGRAVPKMMESFQFHIENSKITRLDLRETPWQILAHLTDSLVPIEERNWVLERYGKRKTSELRGMFGHVPYTLDPQRDGDEVYSLQSFLEYGGPCTHNVQFAGGVFDAFGIPSGWAGGPGHTYPYWFESHRASISIHRTNEIGNRNGKIRNPLGPNHVWEDQLRLLVHELNDSVPKSRNATLAAWAYRRVKEEDRLATAAILPAAIRENPYCFAAISALVDATAAGHLSTAKAGAAWKLVAKALTLDSFQLADFLDRALPAIGADAPTMDGDLALLKTLEKNWQNLGHSGGLAKIPVWRARCLSARGKHLLASNIWRDIAKQTSATNPTSFAAAVDAMAKAVPGAPQSEQRLDLLMKLIAEYEPEPRAGWSQLHRSRSLVVRMAVDELLSFGRIEQAHTLLYEEIAATRGSDPGTGAEPVLVGGTGGGPFLDAPENAELIGVRVSTAHFNGRVVIASVLGIYQIGDEEVVGVRAGQQRPGSVVLKAPTDWRIAGMVATGSDRCDGFQLVYVPKSSTDRRIRMSEWIGSRTGREILIGGRGTKIIGIRGRAGADVDSMGLVGQPE